MTDPQHRSPTSPAASASTDCRSGRSTARLVLGSGAGWALDAMDVGLISFVMAALAVQWDLGSTTISWIASIGFIGMALGASLGGLLADRVGRRQVFAVTLLLYGLATGAAALSWSVASLLVFRFLIGLGLGAELPVASTLVSEFAPARIRGRVVVVLESFWAVGWVLAALIGYFVIPLSDDGWRWALALGAVPAAYSAVVRFGLAGVGPLPRATGAVRRGRGDRAALRELGRRRVRRRPRRRCRSAAPAPTPGPARPVAARPAAYDGVAVGGVVRGELLLLRGVHLDPQPAGRLGDGPGPVLRVHADHHAGAAARLRHRGGAGRGLGQAADAVAVPGRVSGLRAVLRQRRHRRRDPRCRDGAVVLQPRRLGCAVRDLPRGLPDRRCAGPAPAGRPASAGSPRCWRRCRCRSCWTWAAARCCSSRCSRRSSRSRRWRPGACPSVGARPWTRTSPISTGAAPVRR